MNVTNLQESNRNLPSELTEDQLKILNVILDYVQKDKNNNVHYIKSTHISRSCDFSIKKVGKNMKRISERTDMIDIQEWSSSGLITWKLEEKSRVD